MEGGAQNLLMTTSVGIIKKLQYNVALVQCAISAMWSGACYALVHMRMQWHGWGHNNIQYYTVKMDA